MAIIDTLKFRNILVGGKIADEAPAEELVQALDDTFTEQLQDVVTKEHLSTEMRTLRAEISAFKAEVLAAIARSDAVNAQGRLTLFIAIAALLATAVGLILGLN